MNPSLYRAAMEGNLNYLQNSEMITSSYLQSQLTPCQETVLHIAAEFNKIAFAKRSIEICLPLLRLANSSGDTALHIAAREKHEDMVELLISYKKTNDNETGWYNDLARMTNSKNDTALHCAARSGSKRCVELLVQADNEVCSFLNNAEESPLYLFVTSGFENITTEFMKKYPSSSANSYKGPMGLTALHAAVLLNKSSGFAFDGIKLLVEWRKEMVIVGDNFGMTPLHYAAFCGREREIIELFVERDREIIKLFVENDPSAIYCLNNDGQSAFHVAAFSGRVNVLKELVRLRPDCYNMVDKKGRTALHAAVLGNQHEVVEYVIKTPSLEKLMSKVDEDGNTPLHLAAYFKRFKIITSLTKNMKARYILNDDSYTPFDVYDKQDMQQRSGIENYKKTIAASYHLGFAEGAVATHQLANEKLKMIKMEATNNATEEAGKNNPIMNKADSGEDQSVLEVNLLVAMLVATVTFAAGFTVPGGLVDNGNDKGLANLTNRSTFKAFVVFNTLAFCCSIFAVLVHFGTSLANRGARMYYKGIAAFFTAMGIVAMVLAFGFGTSLVLKKSPAVITFLPYWLPASFLLLYPIILVFNLWVKFMKFGRDLNDIPLFEKLIYFYRSKEDATRK